MGGTASIQCIWATLRMARRFQVYSWFIPLNIVEYSRLKLNFWRNSTCVYGCTVYVHEVQNENAVTRVSIIFCSNFGWTSHRELCANWLKYTPVFSTQFCLCILHRPATHSTCACKYQSSRLVWMRGVTSTREIYTGSPHSCNRLNFWT